MQKRRRLIWAVLLLLLGSYFLYNYMYKDHRDISSETSHIEITAPYLVERFKSDDAASLLNSTITVSGLVTNIESGAITIDSDVYCSFDTEYSGINLNEAVKIKGRCIGYDDLLKIVKLDQCSIIK